ncbi:MAG: ABC transporter permease [Lachnospiraceae bacterium]|nr:ABC transporter permease [Lachnospiraceae bacterium]
MKLYIIKRVASFVAVLIGVSMLSFLLIAFSGKDPAEVIARRGDLNATTELIEQVRVEMELDGSLAERYLKWVKGFCTGDFGMSITSYRPIAEDIAEYFPITAILVGMALVWTFLFSVPISLLCARYKNSMFDHLTRGITIFGICIPTFWMGFMLLIVFAVQLKWFTVLPESGVKGYILPSFALAVPVICGVVRIFRSSLLSELSCDYVRYAKARGLSPSRILICHVFRNSLPPIVTVFCQYLGSLIAGSAVMEAVFSIEGIGSYLISSVLAADSTSTATCIVIIAVIFITANFFGDIINRLLCPWIVSESNDN